MNRDESFHRPSTNIQINSNIICGKDLEKGGTWLAIDIKGRFVAVTNIRNSQTLSTSPKSRGNIPLELLKRERFNPEEWKEIVESLGCENFNLLSGDLSSNNLDVYAYSSDTSELKCIKEQIISLSNGPIDQIWDKQRKGEKLFQNLLMNETISKDSIFEILRDEEGFSDDCSQFQKLPIFVKARNGRGTVSSSIILIDYEGNAEFIERKWNEDGGLKCENIIDFSLQ